MWHTQSLKKGKTLQIWHYLSKPRTMVEALFIDHQKNVFFILLFAKHDFPIPVKRGMLGSSCAVLMCRSPTLKKILNFFLILWLVIFFFLCVINNKSAYRGGSNNILIEILPLQASKIRKVQAFCSYRAESLDLPPTL